MANIPQDSFWGMKMDVVALRQALSNTIIVPKWLQLAVLDYLSGAEEPALTVEQALRRIPESRLKKAIEQCEEGGPYYPHVNSCPRIDDILDTYIFYYLPWYFQKVYLPLFHLASRIEFSNRLSILDLGCGPGSLSIGTLEFFKTLSKFSGKKFGLRFTLVDQSPAAVAFAEKALARALADHSSLTVKLESISQIIVDLRMGVEPIPKNSFDLILVGHLFNPREALNNETICTILEWIRMSLAETGSVILIEPGTSEVARVFNRVRTYALKLGFTVFSPCSKLWDEPSLSRCECYSSVEVPWAEPEMFKLTHDLGLPKRSQAPFCYSVLRKDGKVKYDSHDFRDQKTIPLCDLGKHVYSRVSVRGVVYSRVKKDIYVGFGLCDGTVQGNQCLAILYNNIDCSGSDWFRISLGGEALELKNVECQKARKDGIGHVLLLKPDSVVKTYL